MSDRTLITKEIKKEMQRLRDKGLPASKISKILNNREKW